MNGMEIALAPYTVPVVVDEVRVLVRRRLVLYTALLSC